MVKAREFDNQLRRAATNAGLCLISGFVGVSIGSKPDSLAVAVALVTLSLSMIPILMALTSNEDWNRKNTISTLLAIPLLTFSFYFLTDKPLLSVGLVIAWLSPIFLHQRGPAAYQMDDAMEQMNKATEELRQSVQSLTETARTYVDDRTRDLK